METEQPMSYTARASLMVHAPQASPRAPHMAGSRADFLQAVELLAAASAPPAEVEAAELPDADTRKVFLRCSYEAWKQVFGEPEEIVDFSHPSMVTPVHVWKHHCSDGLVRCVGHLLERSSEDRCAVLSRVCLF